MSTGNTGTRKERNLEDIESNNINDLIDEIGTNEKKEDGRRGSQVLETNDLIVSHPQLQKTESEEKQTDLLLDWIRSKWKVKSHCEVYSNSSKQWFEGTIKRIFTNSEGEWLEIEYINKDNIMRYKQTPRNDINTIRPLTNALSMYKYIYNTAIKNTTNEIVISNDQLNIFVKPRRFSQILREKWSIHTENIRKQNETELQNLQSIIKFAKIEHLNLSQGKIHSNQCILIFPQIESSDEKKSEQVTKTDFTAITAYRLPLLYPTCGYPCIDIRALKGNTGITTYDPGYMSTSSCHSTITYIDGPGGRLLHRGYEIQELCDKSDFIDLSFLLLYGELPGKNDRIQHESQIKKHSLVHEKLIEFYKGFRYNAHPMAIMCAVVGALSSFYHDEMDIANLDHRLLSAYRIIAKMPTLAAMAYKTSIGQPIRYPKNSLSFSENFLYMMFSIPAEDYICNQIKAKALDKFLMLHADHEQNASTSTVRIAGSSHANPFACIASGITTLWGPAHGGANEAVLNMLEEIGNKQNIHKYIAKAKDKKDPFRLMGFGHRVYKNYDPRAKVMQKICHELLDELKIENEPLLDLAMELEQIALQDEYFKKRKLFPNVDFYSGIVLKALGIPRSMYTVLFAVGRTIGWISHWKEMIEDPKQRIGRPRQLYLGKGPRKYVDIKHRPDQHAKLKQKMNGDKIKTKEEQLPAIDETKIIKRKSVTL